MPARVKETGNKAVQWAKNNPAVQVVMRYAKLETILASVCCLIPILLIIFDGFNKRDSISEYYNMKFNQVYYYFLTVAAMMFIVNGVIKKQRFYNTILGIMLTGVILFNHEGEISNFFHFTFAALFFLGNGFVMLKYSSMITRKWKIFFAFVMLLSFLSWKPFGFISLFTAEWISLLMITIHYLQEIEPGKTFIKCFDYMKKIILRNFSMDN
jgi:hypothetical protein